MSKPREFLELGVGVRTWPTRLREWHDAASAPFTLVDGGPYRGGAFWIWIVDGLGVEIPKRRKHNKTCQLGWLVRVYKFGNHLLGQLTVTHECFGCLRCVFQLGLVMMSVYKCLIHLLVQMSARCYVCFTQNEYGMVKAS